MIGILYKHSLDNYTLLYDGYLSKIKCLNELDTKVIWVTNIESEKIKHKNIKSISFFGTTFGEIINNFGYKSLNTINKLEIVLKTINKIILKVEIEHKVKITNRKIEEMSDSIVDFYYFKIDSTDFDKILLLKNRSEKEINIDISNPRSRNYNISYTSKYALLNKVKDIYIPTAPPTIVKHNSVKNEKTIIINKCLVSPKKNIVDIKKALVFKDLIGVDKLLFDSDIDLLKDVFDIIVKETYAYSKVKKINLGLDFGNPQDNFAEDIYSNVLINKIKSKNNFIDLYISKIERDYIYSDINLINNIDGLRVISISNNKFIIERDFSIDLDLKKVKKTINLNLSLIIKT